MVVRLDIWLDVACLFKTRSEAQKACKLGQITVNGAPAQPHRELRQGDRLVIARPYGRRQTIVVNAVADRHVAKAEARLLYDDQTPRATPAELEQRRLERMYRAAATPTTRPHRRDRRALRRLSGKS